MADLLSYSLCSVADVKESLGIDSGDTSKDNIIKRKINQATQMIEGFCNLPYNHHFVVTTYTNEEYDGQGSNALSLYMRPVVSVSSFQIRNTTENQDSWSDIDSDDYFVDNNAGVLELNFTQSQGWNRYRVTYSAGFSDVPYDLSESCAAIAAFYVENSASGTAVKRKQEGQRSIEYFDPTSGGGGGSIIEQLGLDDVLQRYVQYNLQDTK
jgi:hypothetical protein